MMEPIEVLYGDKFFRHRPPLRHRAQVICEAVAAVLSFDSVVDVGCGLGEVVQAMLTLGKDSWGIEGSVECLSHVRVDPERVCIHDLREPLDEDWDMRFDLATCWAVMEHVNPEYSRIMVTNLCALSDRVLGCVPLLGSPGAGTGFHEENIQTREHWDGLFLAHGYVNNLGVINEVRKGFPPLHTRWCVPPQRSRVQLHLQCVYNDMFCYEKVG
jgi:hypothetical protein